MSCADRLTGNLIGAGRRLSGVYVLEYLCMPPVSPPPAATSIFCLPAASFRQWHHRLGHLSGSRLSTLVRQGVLGRVSVDNSPICLVGLGRLLLLSWFTLMYGGLLLLYPRADIAITTCLLMTFLVSPGYTCCVLVLSFFRCMLHSPT